MIKTFRYLVFFLCVPAVSWSSTRIINQTFFIHSKPDQSWAAGDKIIVLGAEKISMETVARARKKFPRSMPMHWLLSDDQWNFKNLSLNKDKKVLDFAEALKKQRIQVLPENLCPEPAVFHEKNYEVLVVDSSWFLFPHQVDLFKQQCEKNDIDQFYNEIEGAIINAKLKPLIIISHHGIHRKLVYDNNPDSIVNWANQIHQSLGPMDGISNPAYQKYQEKMNKLMKSRPNIMFVSANTNDFFRDSADDFHHVALSQDKSNQLLLKNNSSGVRIVSKGFSEPMQLKFNQPSDDDTSICKTHTGAMHNFKLKGKVFTYFLGKNYRELWNRPLTVDCFNLRKANLKITSIGGSLRSPDFQLKDDKGNYFKLRPLRKEVRLPQIFKDTILEQLMLDQQSAILPLGNLLAASLSENIQIPHEFPKLVYIDINQKAFFDIKVKDRMSGYYYFVRQPANLLKDPASKDKKILEVVSTKEMTHRLESEAGYKMDQQAYLKARLFDILIGDWDRYREHWEWLVVQEDDVKVFKPYPMDRDSAFYRGEGEIAWWRRRKWIQYQYQTYERKLKHPDSMMIQSMSMDYRFTSNLTQEKWDQVVLNLQQNLSVDVMQKAISDLPVELSKSDKDWIVNGFQKRLKQLPMIAKQMRNMMLENVDVVGTSGNDDISIESAKGGKIRVTAKNEQGEYFNNTYVANQTHELRIYGLDGADRFLLNWDRGSKTKIRLIAGDGKDVVVLPNRNHKPKLKIYDEPEDYTLESVYQFRRQRYEPIYNEFYSQVNQRKLSILSPVLFLASSDADSGFVLGGGIKFSQAGFQKDPWKSTNVIKANAVVNRAAVNIVYQGTWYDVFKTSDFQTTTDVGLPRFYGSFFGLGNNTPDKNPAEEDSFYWMRARHLETNFNVNIPLIQYISAIPRLRFRLRDYQVDTDSLLNDPAANNLDAQLGAGTNAHIENANYYVGAGLTMHYESGDDVSGPLKKRIIKSEATWMIQQGFADEDGLFQTLDVDAGVTGYFQRSKTQWKAEAGFGINFGDWEFFDAQFLGNNQNLRGFFMNRYGGSSRMFTSFEINQSLLFRKRSIITDYGIGGFFDNGRVFMSNEVNGGGFHKALGVQTWITVLNLIAFKAGYARPIFDDQNALWTFTLTTDL